MFPRRAARYGAEQSRISDYENQWRPISSSSDISALLNLKLVTRIVSGLGGRICFQTRCEIFLHYPRRHNIIFKVELCEEAPKTQ